MAYKIRYGDHEIVADNIEDIEKMFDLYDHFFNKHLKPVIKDTLDMVTEHNQESRDELVGEFETLLSGLSEKKKGQPEPHVNDAMVG